jgi:UDP-glucuronate decarboxylase
MTKKTALVTGGAGFLGSYLCDRLLARDYKVICLDNFYTGAKSNISHLLDNSDFTLLNQDVCTPVNLDTNSKLDIIFNFACPASPVHYQKDPIYTAKISIFGALNCLELAKAHGARIIQASTSEVYGDPLEHPQRESYWGNVNPHGIRSCYDEGKRVAESFFFDYQRQHQIDIGVVRIFNTYGPRMSPEDGRVVSNFIVQALKGLPLTIFGDGSQTRSFCYCEDLVDAIMALADRPGLTGPYNIGNDREFSVLELAEKVRTLIGSSVQIIKKPLPLDDPKIRRPDLTKTKSDLFWSPKVTLDEGLRLSIPYFERRIKD